MLQALRAVQYSQRNNVEGEQRRFLDSLASSLIQRMYAERAELVYWRPWEQLIAHRKNDKESAEMLSWGCIWLIER